MDLNTYIAILTIASELTLKGKKVSVKSIRKHPLFSGDKKINKTEKDELRNFVKMHKYIPFLQRYKKEFIEGLIRDKGLEVGIYTFIGTYYLSPVNNGFQVYEGI